MSIKEGLQYARAEILVADDTVGQVDKCVGIDRDGVDVWALSDCLIGDGQTDCNNQQRKRRPYWALPALRL